VTQIVRLGQEFPAAIKALRARRDDMERRVHEHQATEEDLVGIYQINRRLEEPGRTLVLYDKLKALGSRSSRDAAALAQIICVDLLLAKRLDDFMAVESHCLHSMIDSLVNGQLDRDFPASGDSEAEGTLLIRAGKERAVPVYGALLSLNRTRTATRLGRWLLGPQPDGHTYRWLIMAALAAKRLDVAHGLVQNARRQLSEAEWKQIVDLEQQLH